MKKIILISSIITIFFTGCSQPDLTNYPIISFQKVDSIPVSIARSTAVSFVINGKAYITLGRKGMRANPLTDCWSFDPSNNKWQQKSNFPGIGRVNAVAQVVNNKAYVGLGFNPNSKVYVDSAYLNDFWCYDPQLDTWKRLANFPGKTTGKPYYSDGCVSYTYKNYIYVGSGFDSYGFRTEFWKYNTETNKWTQLSDFPGRGRAVATACNDSSHYFFGTGYATMNMNDWWEYFPSSDNWEQKKSMPDGGRVDALSFAFKGHYFVSTGRKFGGVLNDTHLYSDVMEYDASNDSWHFRGDLPGGGRENAICFVINNKVYIGFGENDTEVLGDLWSFTP